MSRLIRMILDFTVEPLTREAAETCIRQSPEIRERMYAGKHHQPGAYSFEEAVLRMQLMADHKLMAAGEVRERHLPRTRSAWLESQSADALPHDEDPGA